MLTSIFRHHTIFSRASIRVGPGTDRYSSQARSAREQGFKQILAWQKNLCLQAPVQVPGEMSPCQRRAVNQQNDPRLVREHLPGYSCWYLDGHTKHAPFPGIVPLACTRNEYRPVRVFPNQSERGFGDGKSRNALWDMTLGSVPFGRALAWLGMFLMLHERVYTFEFRW